MYNFRFIQVIKYNEWALAGAVDLCAYRHNLDRGLDTIHGPLDAICCNAVQCDEHDAVIHDFHDAIVDACLSANECIRHKRQQHVIHG